MALSVDKLVRPLTSSQSAIATALASLTSLRVLCIHLDLEEAPHSFAYYKQGGHAFFTNFYAACKTAARVFSQTLAPSVRWVCILDRKGCNNLWRPYRMVREGGMCSAAFDVNIKELEGVS